MMMMMAVTCLWTRIKSLIIPAYETNTAINYDDLGDINRARMESASPALKMSSVLIPGLHSSP
ncbi:hypothetical protein A2U01_0059871 [Trifolium medium]|uniref:Uncharacterized protein n=1 Tax=Trifolium medium TaxID=97028 RepID=A0A392RPV3_9FABA|nr:hypothetical protein [Trifolium medium]